MEKYLCVFSVSHFFYEVPVNKEIVKVYIVKKCFYFLLTKLSIGNSLLQIEDVFKQCYS